MKNLPLFDILFVILSAVILSGINYLGNSELLGKYSLIVALTAYFVGKVAKNYEIKRKENLLLTLGKSVKNQTQLLKVKKHKN